MPEDVWEKVKSLSETENSDEVVSLDVTSFTKDERGTVHVAIKRCFEKRIVSNTVNKDEKKFLEFKKFNKDSR